MKSTIQNETTKIYSDSLNSSSESKQNIKTYLLNPLTAGLMGFTAFFSLIIVTKFFGSILGTNDGFILQLSDVIYALTGFLFGAGAKFVEFFGKED